MLLEITFNSSNNQNLQQMKKLLLITIFSISMFTAFSQDYKAFKVDIGFGYASPSAGGDGIKGGITFTIEPHYRITDAISAGLRIEGAAMGYEIKDGSGDSDVDISILNSYAATGEYYFKQSGFRPFAGAGFGLFRQSSVTIDDGSNDPQIIAGKSEFGFFPTIGFEAGHFRMSGSYNVLPNDASYLAIRIGFFLGGGKK